jgi:hypothetical protein
VLDQLAERAAAITRAGALGSDSERLGRLLGRPLGFGRAQAMMRLGDVGEHQEQRERTRHRQGLADRQLGEDVAERFGRLLVAGAGALGQSSNLLDALVQAVPGLFAEHLAEQGAQSSNVISQRFR